MEFSLRRAHSSWIFVSWAIVLTILLATFVAARSRVSGGRNPRISTGTDLDGAFAFNNTQKEAAIAVAITGFNDADATAAAVTEFREQPGVCKVIVVDNNSTDDTAARAEAAGATVVKEELQGYGYACMRGLYEALKVPEAEVIVLTEGDGTFLGSDLRKFQAYIDQADMVVGTRVVPGLVEPGSQMDDFFTWGNLAVSALIRLKFWNSQFLGSARLSDVGCTYRAMRREPLERILPLLTVGGSHFSPHMILVALMQGLSIIEIPITFRRRVGQSKGAGKSLLAGSKIGLAMIWHILTYRRPRGAHPAGALKEESKP